MKSRQMMSKFEPGALLRSICQAIHGLTGGRSMVWVTVRQIEDRLGVASAELAPGLQLGMTRRWLLTEGKPVARVALRDAGLTAASRVRKRQESGARS